MPGVAGPTLGMMNIFVGILSILVSIPLLKRKIPMNYHYGFRLKQSYISAEHWYRINAYGAQRLILWSLVITFLGVAALLPPISGNPGLCMLFALTPLLVIVPVVETYIFARQLERLNGE